MHKQKFDPSQIKPLDGSPMISANCWNSVLGAVDRRAQEGGQVRCLEWGGGNSTISLVRKGRKMKNNFYFVSIEHETNFFHHLAEHVLMEFLDSSDKKNLKVTWQPLKGPIIPILKLREVTKEHKKLETSSISWQILLDNKRLQYIDGFQPHFNFSGFKLLKQFSKLILMNVSYFFWLARGVIRSFFVKFELFKRYELDDPSLSMEGSDVRKGVFFEHFEDNPVLGCLKIEQDGVYVELWYLPVLSAVFGSTGTILDASIKQLSDYVSVPLNGKFDIVFIDGRARVSCIKRVYYDNLLNQSGFLFVHDAFRSEMMEGFRLFDNSFSFIRGTNITLNGQLRCDEDFGLPLVQIGDNLDTFKWEIIQELFVYRNSHEDTET